MPPPTNVPALLKYARNTSSAMTVRSWVKDIFMLLTTVQAVGLMWYDVHMERIVIIIMAFCVTGIYVSFFYTIASVDSPRILECHDEVYVVPKTSKPVTCQAGSTAIVSIDDVGSQFVTCKCPVVVPPSQQHNDQAVPRYDPNKGSYEL